MPGLLNTHVFAFVLALVLAPWHSASSAEQQASTPSAPGTSYGVQAFMDVCVANRAQNYATAQKVKVLGFKKASKERAAQYLPGRSGKAWYLENEQGAFGIIYLSKNGVCSVIIHQGDAERLRADLKSQLPDASSGLTYVTETESDSDSRTTTYDIFDDTAILERWIISTSNDPDSDVRAILLYDTH